MSFLSHSRFRWLIFATLALALAFSFALRSVVSAATPGVALLQLSSDPYTNTTSQHQTEVEPDSYANGSTIVAATQVGRFNDGGASNIGWATSTDNGATWQNGFLPVTTVFATPAGQFDRVSDPSVSYDAAHKLWMISSLAISSGSGTAVGAAVIVNTSSNGGLTWNPPVVVANANGGFFDKDWIVCDNTSSSAYYGHCYVEWDINSSGNLVQMSTSSDGGATWSAGQATQDNVSGLGGQPLVQPNGTVIVPFLSTISGIAAFTSTNGGTSWNSSVSIASQTDHQVAGIRSEPLPSAEIDGTGKAYVAWQDCRFENGCSANDIVISTSTDGATWSAPQRVPIDAVGSNIDHFIPGIAVDKATSGSSAHLALAFYYYPNANCTTATCQLEVGYVSSTDGGATWSTETTLTSSAMNLAWLANTTSGNMVGDYISTSFANGKAFPVFVVASAPSSGGQLNEALFTTKDGLAIAGGTLTATGEHVYVVHPASAVLRTAF
ncbi:MAG: exo-alpha-sialidase [Chloroflexi bacterium]|nr:MAG: exo-alpha-sialidase [Chloroflexota bacterium]